MVGNLYLAKCGINSDATLMLLKMDKYRAIITEVQNSCFFAPALKCADSKILVDCFLFESREV